jgi:hypothetical protein
MHMPASGDGRRGGERGTDEGLVVAAVPTLLVARR